jgi:hypothetical protein
VLLFPQAKEYNKIAQPYGCQGGIGLAMANATVPLRPKHWPLHLGVTESIMLWMTIVSIDIDPKHYEVNG